MPTLWPAGPWRFEAAVTITECNEQSVTNWLQFAQIADSARVTGAPLAWAASRRSSGSGCSHLRLGRCQAVGRLVACDITARSAGGRPS